MSSSDLIAKAADRVPPQLRRDEFRFVPIDFGSKRPFEPKWNTVNNYKFDDPKFRGYLQEGYNWGTCTGYGNLIIFDSDNEVRFQQLGVTDELPDTFTVRTGGGGLHRYYICKQHGDKIVMYDNEQVDSDGNPVHLGEIQTAGFQAVGPGSTHPNGSKYRIVRDMPIANVTWEDMFGILDGKVMFGRAREEKEQRTIRVKNPNAYDPFEYINIADVWTPQGNVKRFGNALRGAHPVHGSTGGYNFEVDSGKNVWCCYRCWSGGGPALAIAVKEGLIQCNEAKRGVLRGELFKQVVDIANKKYTRRSVERVL